MVIIVNPPMQIQNFYSYVLKIKTTVNTVPNVFNDHFHPKERPHAEVIKVKEDF